MKTPTATIPYGFQELRQVQQRYMMLALLVAITIQMMIIGAYHLSEQFKSNDAPEGFRVLPIDPSKILPPPLNPQQVSPNIAQIPVKYSAGVPVPVPDIDVNSETPDFAGQDVLSRQGNEFWEHIGDVSDNIEIVIEESDPLPNEFFVIETDPMVIFRAVPEYPEIAKHIGMEGSVVVQVLLDKNGKVKKTLLVKASDDIFIEPALAAAQKWVFTPALMQGKPVAVWMSIPFRFKLTGK